MTDGGATAVASTDRAPATWLRQRGAAGSSAFRWLVLALLVSVQLGLLLQVPVHSSGDALLGDLTAGRVTSFAVGGRATDLRYGVVPVTAGADVGPDAVVWQTSNGLRYETSLFELLLSQDARGDGPAAVRATARAAGHRPPVVETSVGSGDLLTALTILGLVVLLLLRFGPEPRRFTRWGWFWVMLLPLGIGQVWYLLREVPWSRSAVLVPALPPGRTFSAELGTGRAGAGRALLVLLVVGTLVGLVLLEVMPLLTDHHPAASGTWQAPGG